MICKLIRNSKFKKEAFTENNLKHNLVRMKSRTLVFYLTYHFPKNGQGYLVHKRKTQEVRLLELTDISHAIARMDRINHVNDQKRFFFFIGALFTIIATVISTILRKIKFDPDASNLEIVATISMVYTIPIVIYLLFSWAVIMDSFNKATINYFKDLLIQARDEKKNDIEID
ncbi:hypothetical protein RE735_05195 [Bacillus aerius]|uniref:hypothetical protein n=1 Tax=Bacillus aerius TaxID=293388 RepID=UPI002814C5B5|nr:hypothetical protein [Bacillus aerius]WMT29956.1 hypothetical protein RE735_05195 [Bacillus aerius]